MSEREWLSVQQLADELGVPQSAIYAWRYKGTGPVAAKFGKHLRFRRRDVEAWIKTKRDPAA